MREGLTTLTLALVSFRFSMIETATRSTTTVIMMKNDADKANSRISATAMKDNPRFSYALQMCEIIITYSCKHMGNVEMGVPNSYITSDLAKFWP